MFWYEICNAFYFIVANLFVFVVLAPWTVACCEYIQGRFYWINVCTSIQIRSLSPWNCSCRALKWVVAVSSKSIVILCPEYAPPNRHYNDVLMSAMASQIISLTSVYSTVYSGADQRKHHALRHWLCTGNSPVIGEFPAQVASNAENVFHLMTSSWHTLSV